MSKIVCAEDISFQFYKKVMSGSDPVEAFEAAMKLTHKINAEAVTYCGNCTHSKEAIDDPIGRIWCSRLCRYMDKKSGFCCFGEERK